MKHNLDVEKVKGMFSGMQSIDDLADLIQYVYENTIELQKNKGKVKIKTNVLTFYGFAVKEGEGYVDFEIPKKNGEKRQISKPSYILKIIQRCLLEVISIIYVPHKASHGFVIGRNIVTNASRHIGQKYVFNVDIKDFFPTTSYHKINFLLKQRPFFLNGKRERIAQLIASLCCKAGFLPQGAPTSPIVTNIVCRRIDAKLSVLATEIKAKYTRYADDLTFSSDKDVFSMEFIQKVKQILAEDKYELNPRKTRLSSWVQRQEVTGIVVNNKKNLPREYIKDIRYWLFAWKKFGAAKTQIDFEKRFSEKKGYIRYDGATVSFMRYLGGKIQYLKMVKGESDAIVIKAIQEYNQLSHQGIQIKNPKATIVMDDNTSINKQLFRLREILEVRGDFSIDYSFIKEPHWRAQLKSDNLRMENCAIRNIGDDGRLNNDSNVFYDFTKYACFQLELLLNIYFKKHFSTFEDVEKKVEELKSKTLYKKFVLYKSNKTTDVINLYSKSVIYVAIFNIMRDSEFFKGIDIIRELRNSEIAHRPAFEIPNSSPNKKNSPSLTLREKILNERNVQYIRTSLFNFVGHIEKHLYPI